MSALFDATFETEHLIELVTKQVKKSIKRAIDWYV